MKTIKFIFPLFAFILLASFASAKTYDVTQKITQDTFTVTEQIVDEEEFVYEIAPGDFKHITVELEGSLGYEPRFVFYDPEIEEELHREALEEGQSVSFTYTTGLDKGKPRVYYLVVETFKLGGEEFTLTFEAKEQNDAALGVDASYAFRDGLLVEPGSHQGFLGDEDEADHFAIELLQDQEVTLLLVPVKPANFNLKLIDEGLNNRIDEAANKDATTITATYVSPRDQKVYIGVEGTSVYTLDIAVSGGVEPVVVPEPEPVVVPEPVVEEVVEPVIEPVEPIQEEKSSNGLIVIIVILMVVAAVAAFFGAKNNKSKEK